LKQVVKRESIAISELELSNDISADNNDNNDNSHSDMMSEMSMEISSPVGMVSYRYGRNTSSALQRGGNKKSENASKPFRRDTIDKTELNALLDSIDHEDDIDNFDDDRRRDPHHINTNTDDNHSCSMRSDGSMDTLQLAQNIYLMLGEDDHLLPSTQTDDDDNIDASNNEGETALHNLSDISNPTVLSSIPSSNPSLKDKNKKKKSSKKSRKSFDPSSSRVDNSTNCQDVSGISSINLSSNISTDSVALLHDSNRSSGNDNHNDDRMSSICDSEDTMNSRRLTVDPNDLIDLVDDLNSDSREGSNDGGQQRLAMHLSGRNDDDDYDNNVDHIIIINNNNRSNDGNDSSRDSIDTVLLMKQVADTLEELDHSDDDHSGVGVVAMNSLHHNYRRRETIDSTDIAMLNEELNDYHHCYVEDNNNNNNILLDEKKRGIGKIYDNDHKDNDGHDCNDDGSIDNDTVNPGDLLNDSLSTYNSMGESILTMDLIEHVQAAIDKDDNDDDVSDAESDLTSMSLLPLADMLALKNELAVDDNDNRAVGRSSSSSSKLEDLSHINGTSVSKKHQLHTHDMNMNLHNTAIGVLKSCMSSKKKPRRTNGIHSSFRIDQDDDDHDSGDIDRQKDILQSSVRKTVAFGSPQAAEFNKLSPTTNYTPLDRKKTRVLYSMSATKKSDDAYGDIDPITIDNDRILESWDRLTNVSDSDMIDAVVALDGGGDGDDEISLYSSCVDTNISVKRRRQSKLQPILDISPLDSNNDDGDGDDEVVMDSMTESIDRLESMNQSIDGYLEGYQTGDVTETVNLPQSLTELLHQNQAAINEATKVKEVVVQSDCIETTTTAAASNEIIDASRNLSMCSNSKTEEIEMDLHTLMMNISSYNMHQQVLDNNNSNYISHSSSSSSIDPLSSDADTSNISLVGPHYHERSTDQSNDSMRSHDSSSDALGFLIGRTSELEKSNNNNNNNDGATMNDTNLNASSVDDSSIQPPTRYAIDHHNTSTDEVTYNLEGSLQALIDNIASSPLSSEIHDKSCIEEMSAILKTHDHDEGLCNNLANDQMDFSVLVSPSHQRDHDTSDPYTSGSSYDYDGINTSNLDSGRSYSIDTLISTDTFGDMMMDVDVDAEEVDVDVDDDQDAAADLKNNYQTAQLMGRLKALNSDSRSNALLHCSTPSVMVADHGPIAATTATAVVAKSRLSIGLKRKSILNESVNHVGSITADAHNNKRALGNITSTTRKQRRFSIQGSSNIALNNDEEDEDDCGGHKDEDDSDQLIALKSLESSSSVSNFSTALQAEFVDKLMMKLSYFFSTIQSIKTIISNYRPEVQNIVQKTMSDNYHSIYNSTILSKVSIETLLLAWEMKSTDSDVFLQTAINSIGAISEEDQVLMMMIDNDHSDTEQMWLNVTSVNLIAQTSALKSQSRDQSSTSRFLAKALNLTNNAPAQHHHSSQLVAINDKCNVRNMLAEDMSQSEKTLRELTLMVDIINKTTYCCVETFKSSCIKLLVHLSSNIYISLIFHLSKEIDDEQSSSTTTASSTTTTTKLLVESIAVDLIMSKAAVDKKERAFVSSFFANNICNVQMNGPLCAENLEQLEQASDICSLLYKVLTHLFSDSFILYTYYNMMNVIAYLLITYYFICVILDKWKSFEIALGFNECYCILSN
jgi:hypothetical protein